AYDGTNLTWTIQDTTTHVTSPTFSSSLDIPSLVGNAANVGFTGTTDTNTSVQYVNTWEGTFSSAASPSTPTLASLSSTSAAEGSSSLTFTLNGSHFASNTTAQSNGT